MKTRFVPPLSTDTACAQSTRFYLFVFADSWVLLFPISADGISVHMYVLYIMQIVFFFFCKVGFGFDTYATNEKSNNTHL